MLGDGMAMAKSTEEDEAQRLSSEELAELIVDALVVGEVLQAENLQRAIKIVAEEIAARKAMGDY
jgi:hypothetical protein